MGRGREGNVMLCVMESNFIVIRKIGRFLRIFD